MSLTHIFSTNFSILIVVPNSPLHTTKAYCKPSCGLYHRHVCSQTYGSRKSTLHPFLHVLFT